ncbi:MAG: hypothetical protein ALECFALPRED_008124 [Alectoria fallacina]|uniref:RINT1-like protein n=1 Tax=Alectoria fallacina TaxID=1903189 RepID=A0A8H3I2F2_9LECA|nr:MAG: hypothetical protein ALECFALPRED_008124 [Alectoria fallacina]
MAEVAYRTNASRIADEERDIRVEDYLSDKLQNSSDLANIDSLLEDVKAQQVLLQQQLLEAKTTLDENTKASVTHSDHLHQRARQFQSQQIDVDRRLMIVTQSETSDDAVRKFDSSMESLRKLDVAQEYMELLTEVESLSTRARRNFKKSPQAALQPYLRIQNLVNALKDAQPAAENAAPHLIDHVDKTARTLWKHMKDAFASEFEATLRKVQWPGKDITLNGQLEREWTDGVKKLLELQEPELKAKDGQTADNAKGEEPLVLLPLEVMAKPLELRFKYHFEGDRPTNKLDKPEYFLSHVISLLNTYDEFFAIHLQPLLREHFKKSNLAFTSIYIDSTSALLTALLPMLRRKIFALMPQISQQPQLLSHLIHELMNFDVSIRDEWNYDGGNAIEGWKGLTWEILVKKDWFGRWLEVEKNFALSRYQNIIDAPESGEIDYDSVDPGTTKPTYAAIRVNDLLETITDRYRPLRSFSQKLRFLIDIQITIFDRFHSRFHDSLEAYLARTSSIARTVQGVSREAQAELQGLGGLERLCRIYGSAEYLEKKMRDWSDDVFFLDVWDELQDRARRSTGKNLAGPMSVEDVAERTSSTVGSEEDSGALFDETAGAYRRLRVRTESFIQDMLIYSLRESLRPYGRVNPWSSLSAEFIAFLSLTSELDATVQQLNDYLSFLSKVLAQAPLRRIVRQVALAVQAFLWDHVLMRYTFSASGVAQFQRDVEVIWETMDRCLGEGQGELGMRKLKEGLVLLGLPMKIQEGEGNGDEDFGLGLWEVEKRVFRNNESGREVLDELGLEVLSESEARHVLERRIELGH